MLRKIYLIPSLQALLDRLEILIGPVAVHKIAEQGHEAIYARLESLDAHEVSIDITPRASWPAWVRRQR